MPNELHQQSKRELLRRDAQKRAGNPEPKEPTLDEERTAIDAQRRALEEAQAADRLELERLREEVATQEAELKSQRVRNTLGSHLREWGLTEAAIADAVRILEADIRHADVDEDGRFVAHFRGAQTPLSDRAIVTAFLQDRDDLKFKALFAPTPVEPSPAQRPMTPEKPPHELTKYELLKQIAEKDAAKAPGDPGDRPEPPRPIHDLHKTEKLAYEKKLSEWKRAKTAHTKATARAEARRNLSGEELVAIERQREEMQRLNQLRRRAEAKRRSGALLTTEERDALPVTDN
ncbi:MAG: hypothetical protein AAGF92_14625 [Myxococcota bacterium]